MHVLSGCDTTSWLRKGHCTKYYGIWKLPRFSYYMWRWYHSHRVAEPNMHYTISNQEHPWNLLATIYSQGEYIFRSEILKWWFYLKHLWIICNTYFEQPIYIIYFGGKFEMKFLYQSLLKVILLHLSYLMWFSVGQKVFYKGKWMPQAVFVGHAILQLYRIIRIHSLQ